MVTTSTDGVRPVKERPILFQGAMVLSLLAGVKDQTRRLKGLEFVNENPGCWQRQWVPATDGRHWLFTCGDDEVRLRCPQGVEGDHLWVRETHSYSRANEVVYRAAKRTPAWEEAACLVGWKPSIHMPREASRILLEIVEVRVERLQDISEADAIAEGIENLDREGCWWRDYRSNIGTKTINPVYSYQTLWESINGLHAWEANPWVWVIKFKVLRPAIEPVGPVEVAPAYVSKLVAPPPVEVDALCAAHPEFTPTILQAYELGLGDLKQVLGQLDKPRQPGKAEGGLAGGRCINDLPGPLVHILNMGVAARLLEMWLPFGLQHFKGDELRLLRFLEPHLAAFQNRLHASLAARNLFKPRDGSSSLVAAKAYLEEMGDVLSLSLDELNAAPDPREPLAAMKMYNDLGMVQEQPAEAVEAGEELVDA